MSRPRPGRPASRTLPSALPDSDRAPRAGRPDAVPDAVLGAVTGAHAARPSARGARRGTRGLVGLALAAALLLTAGACSDAPSAGSETFTDEVGQGSDGAAAADSAAEDGTAGGSGLGGTEGATGTSSAAQGAVDREIVTRGSATVVADDPAQAAQELSRMVEQAGGRVESRDEERGDGRTGPVARLTVRLPADRVTSTIDALARLGEVSEVSVTTEDVTATGRDLDARIAALTTSTQRLRELMADAADTSDLLAVEQELSDRQADLDALTAQREQLSDQVAMSTLEVWITADRAVVAAAERPGFLGGLENGWAALVTTLGATVMVLGVLLPWIAVAAVVLLAVRYARRRWRAARAERGPGTVPAPDAAGAAERDEEPVPTA